MAPGSTKLLMTHALMAAITAALVACVALTQQDPYSFGFIYSFALMVLCVECWWFEDPQLFNGTYTKGWPFFLFHAPYESNTKAAVPMKPYTRIFSAWHAGGVCFCCFMHVLGSDFPEPQKAQVSLALAMLWIIWATINSWRTCHGGAQFCQMSIMFHSLVGQGCGLAGYWHFLYWFNHRDQPKLNGSETVVIIIFLILVTVSLFSLMCGKRAESDYVTME